MKPALGRAIKLVDGEDAVWDVELESERTIHGRVVDHLGEAASGWVVRLSKTVTSLFGDAERQELKTDENGGFRFRKLRDIDYKLELWKASDARGRSAIFSSSSRMVRRRLAPLRPSANALTVQLSEEAFADSRLQGSIVLPSDFDLPKSAHIVVTDPGGARMEQSIERDGSFTLGPVPPGPYTVQAVVAGLVTMNSCEVDLEAGKLLTLRPFFAESPWQIDLELRGEDDQPLVGAELQVMPLAAPCTESEPGRYSSPPLLGDRCIVVVNVDGAFATRIEVAAGDPMPIECRVRNRTPLKLVLTAAADAPSAWLSIVVKDEQGNTVDQVQSSGGGKSFEHISRLHAGRYEVSASAGALRARAQVELGDEAVELKLDLK